MAFNHYIVTVTPKMSTYAGSRTYGEFTTDIYAETRDEAIKKARRNRREIDGRFSVPCTYRAARA